MSAPGLTLAIETSNPSIAAGVALGRDGAVLDHEPVDAGTRRSDDLMPAIERVCARAGVSAADLGAIAVSLGPGAYTSLRIAVTTAKTLAHALGARVFGVPTWQSLAKATEIRPGRVGVCLASKGDSTACVVIGPDGAAADGGTPRVISAADLESLKLDALIADQHLPAPIREGAGRSGIEIAAPVLDARTLIGMVEGAEASDPDALAPIYAREPDAVTQWRARHGGDSGGS